ncbi:MAG: hypothetical protein ACTSVV_13830 [Promethearchaeota archaeon]
MYSESPILFKTSYDRLIQYILDKITDLNEHFNNIDSINVKNNIKDAINYLESLLKDLADNPEKYSEKDIENITREIKSGISKSGMNKYIRFSKNNELNNKILKNKKRIRVICPVCRKDKYIAIPISIVKNSSNVATFSIPKNMVCNHHFQIFVDKDFKVRGYQKVDAIIDDKIMAPEVSNDYNNDNELFENLIIEGNHIEWKPLKKNKKPELRKENEYFINNSKIQNDKTIKELKSEPNSPSLEKQINNTLKGLNALREFKINNKQKRDMTIEDVYNEFWEFIDDDNELFAEFINKDKRRENMERLF